MLKKIIIFTSFILFTYSLFACVGGVESTSCSFCGDTSLRCLLSPGWNTGVAQSDDEWYGIKCGKDVYTKLKIRATEGGDYSLCKIEDQEPKQCPTSTDTCVGEGVAVYLYQGSEETYWVLAHRKSGDPGFEIHLYCSSGPPPVTTVTTSPILPWDDPSLGKEEALPKITTTTPIQPSNNYENYLLAFGMIVLVIIIAAVILYKFMIRKKTTNKISFFIFLSLLLFLFIIRSVNAEKLSPILSWDDPSLGREEALPKPTEEEIYSSYVESEFGLTSTEAETMGIVLPTVMGHEYDETSEYLIGDVAVGLIFVQGPGEVWTIQNRDEVVSDIEDGLEWLSSQEPRSGTVWLHFIEEVSIDVKPTDYTILEVTSWTYLTLGELDCGGQKCSPNNDGYLEYLNYLRTTYDTDWAFMIFIVLGDHFPPCCPGYIAWAHIHGPYAVMTEGLNGNRYLRSHVTAHETAHIFGAHDEYYPPGGVGCRCVLAGYDNLKIPNLMCERACFPGYERDCVECVWGGVCSSDADCPEGEVCDVDNRCTCTDDSDCGGDEFCSGGKCKHKCMMKAAGIWNICPFIRAQIGWRDCDEDGILDPIDTDGICGDPTDSEGTGSDSEDYMVQGTCSGGCDYTTWSCNGGKTDYCIDDYTLAEYYVAYNSDTCVLKRKDCTELGDDYFCSNGRCTLCNEDLNNDGIIDILDLIILGTAYGSKPGDLNWNPVADLDGDEDVDLLDLIIVATHYGETCA